MEGLRSIHMNTLRPPEKCETIMLDAASWAQQRASTTDGKHDGSLGSTSPFDHKSSSLAPAQSIVATDLLRSDKIIVIRIGPDRRFDPDQIRS